MSESQRIAVIGAGIVGASCALYLQQSGFKVTLFDRDEPGSGATYGNACTFATYGSIPVNRPDLIWRFPRLMFGDDRHCLFPGLICLGCYPGSGSFYGTVDAIRSIAPLTV